MDVHAQLAPVAEPALEGADAPLEHARGVEPPVLPVGRNCVDHVHLGHTRGVRAVDGRPALPGAGTGGIAHTPCGARE